MTHGEMARIALSARAANNPRWVELVLRLCARLVLPPHVISTEIEKLAQRA